MNISKHNKTLRGAKGSTMWTFFQNYFKATFQLLCDYQIFSESIISEPSGQKVDEILMILLWSNISCIGKYFTMLFNSFNETREKHNTGLFSILFHYSTKKGVHSDPSQICFFEKEHKCNQNIHSHSYFAFIYTKYKMLPRIISFSLTHVHSIKYERAKLLPLQAHSIIRVITVIIGYKWTR